MSDLLEIQHFRLPDVSAFSLEVDFFNSHAIYRQLLFAAAEVNSNR